MKDAHAAKLSYVEYLAYNIDYFEIFALKNIGSVLTNIPLKKMMTTCVSITCRSQMSLLQLVKLYILKELAAIMIIIVQARNGTWNNEFVEFRAKFSFGQVALKKRKIRFHRCTDTRHLAEKQYLFVARPQSIGERRLERRKFHGTRGSVGIRHASNARREDARGVTRKARQRDNRGTV